MMGASQTSIQEPADIDIPLNMSNAQQTPMTNSKPPAKKPSKKRIIIMILTAVVILAILVIAGYFIKKLIQANYYFCTRSAKFIPLNTACDGNVDCFDGEDEAYCTSEFQANGTFPVRLISAESVLQVFDGKTWRSVCNDDWTTQHTETACKQLGYTESPTSTNIDISNLQYPLKTGPFAAVRSGSGSTPVHQATTDSSVCRTGSVVSLKCSDCGQVNNADRIVGGLDAHIEDYPWQVSLQNGGHRCGGSLVSSRWIVTAAHCFTNNKEVSRWTVMSGETYIIASGSSVDKIIIHEQYDDARSDYDIAMMRLSSPISVGDKRKPVCLPPKDLLLPDNAPVVVTGWGVLRENGSPATTLQMANIVMINRNTCSAIYGSNLSQRMICAGNLKGGVDSCQGDSGGPLVYLSSSSQWNLVGVVSWGDGCAREKRPGVYSNVNDMLNWIYAVIETNP